MGENSDWIPAGIRNGNKTWTGFLLNMEWEKNPDWIPAGIRNGGKTQFVSVLEYGMGENPDWNWVRIQNEEELIKPLKHQRTE